LALSLVSFTTACKSGYSTSSQTRQGGSEKGEPRKVKVAKVVEMPLGEGVNVNGNLIAFDQATVSVKVPGRLETITVDLGSVVRKGQLIAKIGTRDYELRVEQAEAALAQARARVGLPLDGKDDKIDPEQTASVRQAKAVMEEARLTKERASQLVKDGVISKAEYDSAVASFKVAEGRYEDAIEEIRNRQALIAQRRSELALARQQLSDTSVLAPFDGKVEVKNASVGEYVAAGAPIVSIVKVNPLRFRAEVPERESKNISVGQNIRLSVDGATANYSGRITRLSPSITQQNRVLVIEADIANDGSLRPGTFARAEIVTDDSNRAVTVPSNAIVTFAGIEKVILVENGKAVEKPVTTGKRSGDLVEILSGVNIGDMVVINPGNLQSGQAVTVAE
jgi:RND family efflux transporter MFP subunit